MAWNRIIGQDRIKNILQKAIIEQRISHAYCFWGIEGCGKDALALEFAKACNCKNPIVTETEYYSCGHCNSCKLADSMQNPNILMLFSLPTPKGTSKEETAMGKMTDEQIAEIQEQINLKCENPYHKISMPGANQIKIGSVRDLKRNLMMTSMQHGRRFIIISHADEMTVEAANAFLKTLEEPHSDTTIIMTTAKHEMILPTIMSRSQQVHCEPIADEDIIESLEKYYNISKEEGKLISAFAQGSYTQALEYLDADMTEFRKQVVDMFRNSLKKNVYRKELIASMEEIIKKKDKKILEKLFTLLMIWLRDAMIIMKTDNVENVINIDQIDVIKKFASNFSNCEINEAVEVIESSILKIKRNVQAELIFLSMFLGLRKIFLGDY
jgi:DNA polymerase III subunit delta'